MSPSPSRNNYSLIRLLEFGQICTDCRALRQAGGLIGSGGFSFQGGLFDVSGGILSPN